MKKKTELFDFAKLLGAHISFSGLLSGSAPWEAPWTNVKLMQGNNDSFINGGQSVFGRSPKGDDIDGACQNLAKKLTEAKTIQFRIGGGSKYDIHVPPLKHTKGYRG
jgi:hypothetical protein